jgi:hypothetical protein
MNWNLIELETHVRAQERGRPGPRLARGVLWAAFAVFLISVLAFAFGQVAPEP